VNAIIRSVCVFSKHISPESIHRVDQLEKKLVQNGYVVQTKRICTGDGEIDPLLTYDDKGYYLSLGSIRGESAKTIIPLLCNAQNISCNIDLTNEQITQQHLTPLYDIIQRNPAKTFNMTYVFNNAPSSPFFPSARYLSDGFSVGLQPTDLSKDCTTIDEWLHRCKAVWNEITSVFQKENDFLGIDNSVAPLFTGDSSFIYFIKRMGYRFSQSTTTDIYTRITDILKKENPKPVGLCGLMFPCLEDFELAEEYEQGEFSIERNIFVSLHCGLGVDTYPIGIDEDPKRLVEILVLVQALSRKYTKPLSVRFVSDGKAKIGDKTDFNNQYLKDVTIRQI
jgi:hypothetical protein